MRRRDLRAAVTAAVLGIATVTLLGGIALVIRADMVTSDGGGPRSGDLIRTESPAASERGITPGQSPGDGGSPVGATPRGPETVCRNAEAGYSLAYPTAWFVHPPDADRGIPGCALFGAEPFDFVATRPPGLGASVSVTTWTGSCLEFDSIDPLPDVLNSVTIGGHPAFEIQFRPPGALKSHGYLVNLSPESGEVLQLEGDASCEQSHALSIRADGSAPGDYELNRHVVDRMAATLSISGHGGE